MHVAEAVHVVLVPVAAAWARAINADPKLVLYAPDGYHPSRAGTYLAACVFVSTLVGQATNGLPPLDVSPEVASELEAAATQR